MSTHISSPHRPRPSDHTSLTPIDPDGKPADGTQIYSWYDDDDDGDEKDDEDADDEDADDEDADDEDADDEDADDEDADDEDANDADADDLFAEEEPYSRGRFDCSRLKLGTEPTLHRLIAEVTVILRARR
ncbi:phosphopantothenoylcysteine decarboxylase subunit VHS3-like [Penaeus chinensis]|uniref:phosphopantothenoylcysteine decarboxylase subunit VHS3-like n=1 Tax=Penaeus chinensis TaxID=139456 RepID=UPI001FB5C3E8|nr:phosphopantothenoylcysteine decarboxylase subunit VHS3-like [Penaeus chinensis]